ncbi:hypothetical protein [Streptomyces sp. ODS28]|uniref:hypothetical protein n=1 Tax=Streptomyces sp. ODS28 TaxID=3136688 RepID=UPI0031ED2697
MRKQTMPSMRRFRRTGARAALGATVTAAALAVPAGAAFAMPTDYVKEVKADSGETLKLDSKAYTATVSDPEHGVTGQVNPDSGPVQSRMDPNGTFTMKHTHGKTKIIYKHDGRTAQTFAFPMEA